MASESRAIAGDVDSLSARLHGNLIRPGDPPYDEARALYNAMVDKRPALIACCADVEDVVAAVDFGRTKGLDIAVRCGGPQRAWPRQRRRRAGDRPLRPEGHGRRSGHAHRHHRRRLPRGRGRCRHARARTGNAGRDHLDHRRGWSDPRQEILSWYREFILNATEDLNGFFALASIPPAPPFPDELQLRKVAAVVWCWTGSEEGAADALAEARSQPDLLLDAVEPMPYPALQTAFDDVYPAPRPVVLASRLRGGDPGRGGRTARRVRSGDADVEIDDAPLPDRRSCSSGGPDGDTVGLSERELGDGDGGCRPGPREQSTRSAPGRRSTRRRSIPFRRAAHTST